VARQAGITCDTILQNEDFYTLVKRNSMNVLTRRREYGTYLATARRHRRIIKMHLYSPAMSTGSSQVGTVLSPPCLYISYHYTFPGFPFILVTV